MHLTQNQTKSLVEILKAFVGSYLVPADYEFKDDNNCTWVVKCDPKTDILTIQTKKIECAHFIPAIDGYGIGWLRLDIPEIRFKANNKMRLSKPIVTIQILPLLRNFLETGKLQ